MSSPVVDAGVHRKPLLLQESRQLGLMDSLGVRAP